ncbi:cofactor-independent phosphoglycerate mutase [Geothermobacter hydrogeniphilus]|uniref:Cofactor-independent phosphoglycerate mutase n=1 Tax=Geothermobacter hydrogeniphilus TaxID=1969733 RepID=A0A2K2HD28_9BACT|nr:cofactor-independent phosphoglycerate mutase [Geothermobacter hydrogeniphilus]PNU21200.1 cofactor-independent phosphoglycerate mutase [Geothermobacter hydrogeniphilus]
MKYLVLLGDGMADEPMEELGGLTPLEKASTPHLDRLAGAGTLGLARTVPVGFHPGSDVANLSVFGYDPHDCYSGRSPLEAASMHVELAPEDVAFRLNLVHLEPHFAHLYMSDFSAGHIPTDQARELIASLQDHLGNDEFSFHPGISYRHLLVWKGGKDRLQCTPPHDISNQCVGDHLPRGEGAEELIHLTTQAQIILANHPLNRRREEAGEVTANSIWLWGQGRAPQLADYRQLYGLNGAVISAVDLIKGIGVYAGLDIIEVPGATGYIDTNYRGKADAALAALKSRDFVYLHVEAPDEAAHAGNLEAKIQAIEDFDAQVVGRVLEGLNGGDDFRLLVLPDHPTPVSKMTHTSDPVPFVLYDSRRGEEETAAVYSEKSAAATGLVEVGHQLLPRLLEREVSAG